MKSPLAFFGKVITTFVFGILGIFVGFWVAFESEGGVFVALTTVPVGVVLGPVIGMMLFKIIGKLLSRKKDLNIHAEKDTKY